MAFLYVIKCGEYHKIGIANNMKSRMASLQTGNPIKLELITYYEFENPVAIEQAIHQKFVKNNVTGEWFSLNNDDLTKLDDICLMFDGKKVNSGMTISEIETNTADLIGSIHDSLPQDDQIQRLIKDGWRIERWSRINSNGERDHYWQLAKTQRTEGKRGGQKLRIYGGKVLPNGDLLKSTNIRGGVRSKTKKDTKIVANVS